LKTALHDHGPRDQDIVRGRDRTVALVGAKTRKLGVEPLSPQNGVAAITGVSEIQRVRHLWYEAAYQLGVASVTVGGKDQGVAADALATSIASRNLDATHASVLLREQRLRDASRQHDNLAQFGGIAQAINQLAAGAAGQAVHAERAMAWIVEILDQLERQCVALREPFDQRSRTPRYSFDQRWGRFATSLALDVGHQTIWTIDDALSALKACASGRNEPGRQRGRAAWDGIALNHDRVDARRLSGQSCTKSRSAGANDQERYLRVPFSNMIKFDCTHGVAWDRYGRFRPAALQARFRDRSSL